MSIVILSYASAIGTMGDSCLLGGRWYDKDWTDPYNDNVMHWAISMIVGVNREERLIR